MSALRRGSPDPPRTGHDHHFSGSRRAVPVRVDVAHEALETSESMVCGGGDGKETLQGYLGLDPRVASYAQGDWRRHISCYTFKPDPAYIHPGLTGVEYAEGVDGA